MSQYGLDLKQVISYRPLARHTLTRTLDGIAKWIEEVASNAHLDYIKSGQRPINPLTLSAREAKLIIEYLQSEGLTGLLIDQARALAPVSFPQAPGQPWNAVPTPGVSGRAQITELDLTFLKKQASDLENRFRANQHEPAVQKKIAEELAVLLNILEDEERTLRNRSRVHGRGSLERQRRAIAEANESIRNNARSVIRALEFESGRSPGIRWRVQIRPGGGLIQTPVPRTRR